MKNIYRPKIAHIDTQGWIYTQTVPLDNFIRCIGYTQVDSCDAPAGDVLSFVDRLFSVGRISRVCMVVLQNMEPLRGIQVSRRIPETTSTLPTRVKHVTSEQYFVVSHPNTLLNPCTLCIFMSTYIHKCLFLRRFSLNSCYLRSLFVFVFYWK